MERASKSGLQGITIVGFPYQLDVKGIKDLLSTYNLECVGTTGMWPEEMDLINPDEKVRRKTVQYIKDCCKMSADLGGNIFSGLVPSAVGKIKPLSSPRSEWEWAVEGIREAARYAEDLGIKLGIEPINRFETYFINRAEQALKLMKAVNMDNVKVVLDSFHLNIEEASPIGAILSVGSNLMDFHVADSNRMPPGKGHLDWRSIIIALKHIGYDGYLTLEFLTPIDRTAFEEGEKAGGETDEVLTEYIISHGSGTLSKRYYDEATKWSVEYLKMFI